MTPEKNVMSTTYVLLKVWITINGAFVRYSAQEKTFVGEKSCGTFVVHLSDIPTKRQKKEVASMPGCTRDQWRTRCANAFPQDEIALVQISSALSDLVVSG